MPVYRDEKRSTWYFRIRKKDLYGNVKEITRRGFKKQGEAKDAEARELLKTDSVSKIKLKHLSHLYLNDYKSNHKESSYYRLEEMINEFIIKYLGDINIYDLSVMNIKEWQSIISNLTYNGKYYSLAYKRKIQTFFSAIISYGIQYYELKQNVVSLCGGFKEANDSVIDEEIRYITPDEYYQFRSTINDLMWQSFFSFLYWTGCRKGEVQALTWNDIDLETKFVKINKTLSVKTEDNTYKITNTKNRKNRTILMPDKLMIDIIELYNRDSKLDGFSKKWFVFGGIRHLAQTTIDNKKNYYYNLVDEKIKPKKFNRITNHEFRHSHASVLISNGVPVSQIAERLGDTEAVVLKTYTHLFPNAQQKVVDLLNKI